MVYSSPSTQEAEVRSLGLEVKGQLEQHNKTSEGKRKRKGKKVKKNRICLFIIELK